MIGSRALVSAGVASERGAYNLHITLARLNRQAGPVGPFMARATGLTSVPAVFDAFFLFESRLGSDGAIYEAIARYPR